jgi:hypothetical protein
MLMIDLRNGNARITLHEMMSARRDAVSNPIAFASFASGLSLPPELLTHRCWQLPAGASGGFSFFRSFMHEVVPAAYDARHLQRLGGRFALRLTGGAGDFTVITMLRRVITLRGLPLDEINGRPVCDAEMRSDVFLAYCNELLAKLSEQTLIRLNTARPAMPS